MKNQQILDDESNEKKVYKGKLAGIAWKIEQAEEKIKQGRVILYVLSGFIFLSSIVMLVRGISLEFLIPNIVLIGVYVWCGYNTIKRPVISFIIALSFYLGILLFNYIVSPTSWFQGIIWKSVIIIALITGLYYGYKGEKLRKQLEKIEQKELIKK